jgi:Ca2+-binding EF-hand superfamily protein
MKFAQPLACLAALACAACSLSPHAEDRFALADANHDGKLSRKEASDAAIGSIFRSYDADNDGRLTLDEWRRKDPAAEPKLFRRRDTDGDGTLTLDEARASADRQDFLGAIIRKGDLDGDELLSREEAARIAPTGEPVTN